MEGLKYILNRRSEPIPRSMSAKMTPLAKGDLPTWEEIQKVLAAFSRYTYFKSSAPVNQLLLPPEAPNKDPFDMFHQPILGLTPRDMETTNDRRQAIPPRYDRRY
jgi:hypothetical protein